MLLKKFKHDEVEKFCVMMESKAWGKGVGTIGEDGTVGKTWDAAGTDDEVAGVGADGDDGDGAIEDVGTWGSLFQFDWSEINPCHERGEEAEDTSLVEKRPYTVNAITMNGTRIAVHRNRLPVLRFVWSEFRELQTLEGVGIGAEVLNPSVVDGWGEGGGVNIILAVSNECRIGNECACKMSVVAVQWATGTKEIRGRVTSYADDEY